ncbi:MAG: oligosaccharide flippase family protein [Erysipelothrix sp.]|nr:oligosaccharide flippase family protein [Erysipelothrix sp.]
MKKYIYQLRENKFFTSFSILASGSLIAQIVSIIASPITTRLFSPSEFGRFTIIATAVSIFGPILSLKYDMSIVSSENKQELNALIKLSFIICFILSTTIGVIYARVFLYDGNSSRSLVTYFFILSLLLFTYGLNNILLAYNNKLRKYNLISSVTVIKSTVNSIFMIVTGFLNLGVSGLVGSQLISSIFGLARQFKGIRLEIEEISKSHFSILRKVLTKYRRQPFYNASTALVTTLVYSGINIFIKIAYSFELLGFYSLSYRVLGIPFSVISANIARIFYETASSEMKLSGSYHKAYKTTLKYLLLTIIPIMAILAVVSPFLFSWFFGKEWTEAGNFVRLLAPMFAARLVAESLTTSFIISEKQHIELIFQTILLIGEIFIFAISIFLSFKITLSLFLISILYVLVYVYLINVMNKLSKGN